MSALGDRLGQDPRPAHANTVSAHVVSRAQRSAAVRCRPGRSRPEFGTARISGAALHAAPHQEHGSGAIDRRHDALAIFPMAALTLGITFSASKVIERLPRAGSRQSLPA
jgi:hypothetical protein